MLLTVMRREVCRRPPAYVNDANPLALMPSAPRPAPPAARIAPNTVVVPVGIFVGSSPKDAATSRMSVALPWVFRRRQAVEISPHADEVSPGARGLLHHRRTWPSRAKRVGVSPSMPSSSPWSRCQLAAVDRLLPHRNAVRTRIAQQNSRCVLSTTRIRQRASRTVAAVISRPVRRCSATPRANAHRAARRRTALRAWCARHRAFVDCVSPLPNVSLPTSAMWGSVSVEARASTMMRVSSSSRPTSTLCNTSRPCMAERSGRRPGSSAAVSWEASQLFSFAPARSWGGAPRPFAARLAPTPAAVGQANNARPATAPALRTTTASADSFALVEFVAFARRTAGAELPGSWRSELWKPTSSSSDAARRGWHSPMH
jgi:hypothetical protein